MQHDDGQMLKYGIDRLVAGERRLFGWGWVAHRSLAVRKVELLVEGGGQERCLTANHGLGRDDVAQALPDWPHAATSGFVVSGYVPDPPGSRLTLLVHLSDGGTAALSLGEALETLSARRRKWKSLMWITRSVWRRLRRLDLRGIVSRARAQNYVAPTIDDESVVDALLPKLSGEERVTVIFDHNMGGGANLYRQHLIEDRLGGGENVLLCTYTFPTLDYRLYLFCPGRGEEVFRMSSFLTLTPLMDRVAVHEIVVNSPVSFDEPLLLAEWLVQMRSLEPHPRLTLTAHDYFFVCPSFVLLNADGRYCGVPDIGECDSCLERHRASFVALSPPTGIGAWRAAWGRCLSVADEVRCFSTSTRELLLKAYPDIAVDRLSVVPHRVDYCPERRPALDHTAPLTIGVIGQISFQKGAGIVTDLVGLLDRKGLPVRVVVIGTLDSTVTSDRLAVTGQYRREELVDLIEAHEANLFLFPSICPETFSYTTEEMILLGLPIVAFDLGAPGNRLRDYELGRLCPETSAQGALDTLLGFHRQLAARDNVDQTSPVQLSL